MSQRAAFIFSVLTSWVLALVLSVHVAAEPENLPPDVRLIIDVSGSMKQNDPNNLRQPAVELLVQLLPENSKAGIWTFGQWVNMLVPHKPVTEKWKERSLGSADKINSAGLYTNIGAALEKAAYDRRSPSTKYRTSIILLTDGMVDIDKSPEKNQKEWRRIVDDIIPELKRAGYVIHTIALSDNADTNLLNKLSLGTDGIAEVAHNAEDLMKIFLKAFDVAVPVEQVPLLDNRFSIDSSVEEFTALIFREMLGEQTTLIGPDNSEYTSNTRSTDVNWHRAASYDLITVKRPLEGEWGVKASMAPESRVTVVSNLNLKVRPLPNNIFKGQQVDLSLMLKEDGKTITRSEFLSLMDISAVMEAGRDEFELQEYWREMISDSTPPEKGIYQTSLPTFDKDGIYQLNIVVDGKSFIRQFTHQFNSRQPFGANIKSAFVEGELVYLLTANAYSQDINVTETQIVATVTAPDGRKKINPLESTEEDTWRTNIYPDQEGNYVARIRIRGENSDGNTFDLMLEDIRFNYSEEKGFVEEPEPFFEEPEVDESEVDESEVDEPEVDEPEVEEVEETVEEKTEDKTENKEKTASAKDNKPPQNVENNSILSNGMTYSLLGIGNLLLFGLGFFAYKFITKGSDDDLDEFTDENLDEKIAEAETYQPEEPQEEESELQEEEPEDEEPPMEDLEPQMGISDIEAELEPVENSEEMAMELGVAELEEIPIEEDEPPILEAVIDEEENDFDDLDAMLTETDNDEEDDMVAAMLKAQGLDLAEEELDDAISDLIDDIEEQNEKGDSDGMEDLDDL